MNPIFNSSTPIIPPPNLNILSSEESDLNAVDKFIKEANKIMEVSGKVFINRAALLKCVNPETGQLDDALFYEWIQIRASTIGKYPLMEDGRVDLSSMDLYRRPCKRDLSQFGWPEIPLDEYDKSKSGSVRHYKFQVSTKACSYVAYVYDTLMDFVNEDLLYKEGDSDLLNQTRMHFWKSDLPDHAADEFFEEHPKEHDIISEEVCQIQDEHDKALYPQLYRPLSMKYFLEWVKEKNPRPAPISTFAKTKQFISTSCSLWAAKLSSITLSSRKFKLISLSLFVLSLISLKFKKGE